MTNYQAILFDLDGTLIDSAHTFTQLLNEMRAQHHLPPLSEEEVRTITPNGANALVCAALGISSDHEKFASYKQEFLKNYYEFLERIPSPFFPGIDAVLHLINERSIPWGIITNKQQSFTQKVITGQPLLATASTVISGDTLPVGKPDPAPVLYACEQLAVSVNQTIFIGDHINDIQAGKNAGTTTGLALYGYLSPIDDPDSWQANILFASAEEIYKFLQSHTLTYK